MKTNAALGLSAIASIAVIVGVTALASENADENSAPIFLTEMPQGYRDLRLISVSRLTRGDGRSQLRAELGNDIAIKAYREGNFLSRTAQSLPRSTGTRSRRRTTTKSSPKVSPAPASNLLFPARA
jgi:hypothetical protein